MSEQAKSALINTSSSRQGTVVPVTINGETEAELRQAGLIGEGGGLTRKGSIKRERVVNAALDEAFGL